MIEDDPTDGGTSLNNSTTNIWFDRFNIFVAMFAIILIVSTEVLNDNMDDDALKRLVSGEDKVKTLLGWGLLLFCIVIHIFKKQNKRYLLVLCLLLSFILNLSLLLETLVFSMPIYHSNNARVSVARNSTVGVVTDAMLAFYDVCCQDSKVMEVEICDN